MGKMGSEKIWILGWRRRMEHYPCLFKDERINWVLILVSRLTWRFDKVSSGDCGVCGGGLRRQGRMECVVVALGLVSSHGRDMTLVLVTSLPCCKLPPASTHKEGWDVYICASAELPTATQTSCRALWTRDGWWVWLMTNSTELLTWQNMCTTFKNFN